MGNPLLLTGLAGIAAAVSLALAALLAGADDRRRVSRSLAAVAALRLSGSPVEPQVAPFLERVLTPAHARLAGLAHRFTPAGVAATLQRRLDVAGNPHGWTADRVMAVKGAGLVAGGGLGLLLGPTPVLLRTLCVAGVGAIGLFLPDVLLYNAGLKRQDRIRRTLPDSIDLLTISVEAGLGFDAALDQVAKNTDGPLAGELSRVLQEMQIGKSRAEAFRAVLDRTDVVELRAFVSSIVQADSLGIPVARVLREQSKELRIKRRQLAEERAQKVPVKILVPLVLCVFPALFVVVIGPGVIGIMDAFGS